tara:strand:+ start:281 stop:691 length:411 start_codon:yes stop_codon:yes gene_type:complete
VVALAAFANSAPNNNLAWGVVPSTNEVFFRNGGQFPITVIVPSTGMYQVSLTGRPGSYEFDASSTSLCTQPNIASVGNTNSVKLCGAAGCQDFHFGKGETPTSITHKYALEAGVNTLYLKARELCTLTGELVVSHA